MERLSRSGWHTRLDVPQERHRAGHPAGRGLAVPLQDAGDGGAGGGEARDAGVSGALGGNGVDAPLHTRGIHNPSSGWVDVSWGFRLPDSSS